jgi:DNA-directed RNA polymerase subunit M/transcription elongation factor TFIIS
MSDQPDGPKPHVLQFTVDCRECGKTLIADSPNSEFEIECDKCGYKGPYKRSDVKIDQPQA